MRYNLNAAKMMWTNIQNLAGCERVTPPGNYPEFYWFRLSDGTGWLVGRYNELTRLATNLRDDAALRDFLSRENNRVRLGLRASDAPPAGVERQERYGSTVAGVNAATDFRGLRLGSSAPPVNPGNPAPINRKSDREENVKTFWATQTPQSHHIVEFNNLETLGFSKQIGVRDQDYLQLPAVLLAAEFHQRYFSAILKPAQHLGKARLEAEIVAVYRRLYLERSPLFEPLWSISAVILAEAVKQQK